MLKNIIRHTDIEILRAIKSGKNSNYVLSIDRNITVPDSSTRKAVNRLVKYGFLEKGEVSDRGKIPLIPTAVGNAALSKIKARPLPNDFNGPIDQLYYRIVEEDGVTSLCPVYHGSVPPNYKIKECTP